MHACSGHLLSETDIDVYVEFMDQSGVMVEMLGQDFFPDSFTAVCADGDKLKAQPCMQRLMIQATVMAEHKSRFSCTV